MSRLKVELDLDDRGFQRGADDAGKHASRLKGVLGSIGTTAAGFLAANVIQAGFGALKNNIGSVISAASDMNETLSKTDAVFGSNSDAVKKWGDQAASTVGLSTQAALEAASSLGNLFKGVGVANTELPAMSENIVQAAADLGSFNNVDPGQVVEDLRSGLVGQAEPLRKYGILINEAAVQAKGLELGLGDANGELSEGAKVQARYALIMAQLGDAQGDFAKTSGGLANGTRILSANITNLKARIGKGLVPVLAKGVSGVNKWFKSFDALQAKGLSPFDAALVATRGTIESVFGKGAGRKFASFADTVIGIFQKIASHKEDILSVFKAILAAWWTLEKIGFQIMLLIIHVFEWAWGKIRGPVERFVKYIRGLDFKHGALGDLIDIFQAMAKGDWGSAFREITNVIRELGGVFAGLLERIGMGRFADHIRSIFDAASQVFSDFVTLIGDIIHGRWGKVWGDLKTLAIDALKLLWEELKAAPAILMDLVGLLFQAIGAIDWGAVASLLWDGLKWLVANTFFLLPNLILDWVSGTDTFNAIWSAGWTIVQAIGTGITAAWNWLWGWFKDLPGRLSGVFSNVFNEFWNIGYSIISGMSAGIQYLWDTLVGWINSILDQFNRIPAFLRPGSPSKTMREYGKSLSAGLAVGIAAALPRVATAIGDVNDTLAGTSYGAAAMPKVSGVSGAAMAGGSSSSSFTFAPGSIVVNNPASGDEVAKEILRAIRRQEAGSAA